MNALKKSFAPLVGEVPAVLILGTLPGERSLAAGEYYAHSANRFWSMIAHVTDEPVPKNYEAKKQLLAAHRIALWDVAHSANCARNNTEMIASWGQIKEFVKSVRLCAKISG